MLFKGVKVLDVNLVVYLKEKATENFKDNENYVAEAIVKEDITDFGVENPIDDMVYIYLYYVDEVLDTDKFSKIYEMLKRIFPEVKVNLGLDNCLDGVGNTVDLTLEEFLEII